MTTTRTKAALAAACLAMALTQSACSSSPDTAEANAAYCEGAEKVQSEVETLATLVKGDGSADMVKTQWGAVQAAIEANSVPLSQLSNAVKDDIAAAEDALTAAIDAIPEGATPAEAAPQYQAAIDAYTASITTVQQEVGCS
jgi:hypothetical protein